MRTVDKFFKAIAALLFVGFVVQTGCSRREPVSRSANSAQSGKPAYKFVVVSHATAVPFFVPVRKGVEEAGLAGRGDFVHWAAGF